ncbi:porin [Burkholderia guangdongensis]|uniref:porin n=1 Tax=Burkholderia guangdongensis TaxID=1792500 RepID=UPI0015CD31B4|nr:porin [Burkholderia guangdongensis]
MKSRATQLATIAGACALLFGAAAPAHADGSQLSSALGAVTTGFGPGAWGVTPNTSYVTLYGSVDMAVNYVNAGGKSMVRMQSGNVWTSKIGLYGQEDLGDQWTAFFRLESGITANNGAQQDPNSLFNRASYVGLDNPHYGKITLGRTYSVTGTAALGVDPFYANGHESLFTYMGLIESDLGHGATADGANRMNNLINYTTPRFLQYFTAGFSYGFKTTQNPGPAVHTRAASLSFNSKSTIAGLAYGQTWCDPGFAGSCTPNTGNAPSVRTDLIIADIEHDFGPVVGQAGFMEYVPHYPGDAIAKIYTVGMQRYAGRTLYRIALDYRDTTIKQDYAWGATLGTDYYLSKRTSLYTRVGFLRNGPQSALTYNYDSTSGSTLVSKGHSITSVSVGIAHQF